MRSQFLAAAMGGALNGAGIYLALAASPSAAISAKPEPQPSNAISWSAMDMSVDACEDFYRRSCGGFIATAKPNDATPSIDMTAQQFEANLDRNLEALFLQNISDDPELARLKTFHASCLNGGTSDVAAVKDWLARIDAVQSPEQLQTLLHQLSVIGVDPFFTYSGQPDRKQWSRYRGEIHNAYLWADEAVVARTFSAAGLTQTDAEREAAAVASIVTALRKQRGDRYDASTAENPLSLAQLEELAPSIDWPRYFVMVGAAPDRTVNVTAPAYLRAVEEELTSRSLADIRAFLRWSFLFSLRGELPHPYNRTFGDIIPALRVQIANPAGRCRDATVRAMGVEFSRQYATRILGWKARDAAQKMAEDIKFRVVASIAGNEWLSPEAREATVDKLTKTDLKIGYPNEWPEVGGYPLDRSSFFANVLAARTFEQRRNWRRANQDRSRTGWEMIVSPWVGDGIAAARLVVPNGFPDALSNSLIVTAAFLGAPRFDPDAPPELNYATFGAVFGHEFVHVIEAHMFGADGSDRELWGNADIKAKEDRGQCVINQASDYEALPGVKMSGERQYGENVADYGGVRLAFEALEANLGDRVYQRDSSGTSPAQRFFYRYAQNRCTAQTEGYFKQSVASNGHAPAAFRINAPLSNLPAFGRAFSCKANAKMMRPAERQCRLW
ncbi:M13 family metallopeptidase [Allosphingosinicella vermicomposti]|uniref:M13 family metallopeptidase n=1 Tax=Allosphingosinicella vermicomposti TaxID=614671 RepID=UPI000D0F806E|nr:M13 family metallopeptidase [Allosphingosinicella vermicomposti]